MRDLTPRREDFSSQLVPPSGVMAEGKRAPLEREGERAAVERGLDAAASGSGALLIIEGPAGIGKTTVLDDARGTARLRKMQVLTARAASLERDIANGVVRQLLEPRLRRAAPKTRDSLLAGAAALAAPVVLLNAEPPAGELADIADRRSPVVHGLYWLVANIAADAPLLLAVDDLQWSDAASLRFLAYIARRLTDLPVLVVVTVRTGETPVDADALSELMLVPGAHVIRPQALSTTAVAQLAQDALGGSPDAGFVFACREATGGVPFLLVEMFKSLAAAGVSIDTSGAASVTKLTSDTVAHATLLRLSRLSPEATAIAQCVAVLGRHAQLGSVARLSKLHEHTVLRARDALVSADLMHAGPPMTFVHPIVAASIYHAIPRGQRSMAHAAAAHMLTDDGADVEDVAAHLLLAEPGAAAEALDTLRAAARVARTRGAPESAAAYLERALLESTAEARAHVLHELAQARSVLRQPLAVERFHEAIDASRDPAFRARVAVDLVETLMVTRQWDAALHEIDTALAIPASDSETTACLEVFRAHVMAYDVRLVDRFEATRPRLAEIADRDGRSGRLMAALLAACAVARNEPPREVVALSTHALADGLLMAGADAEAWGPFAAARLAWLGQHDVALAAAEQMRDAAQRRGSVYGFVRGTALHALALARAGDLRGAEADIRGAYDLARDGDALYGLLLLLCWAVDALLERPGLDDVARVFEVTDVAPLDGTYLGAWFLETRGRLRRMRGERAKAADDLRRCGGLMKAFHTVNPMLSRWRSECALALPDSERAEALHLVDEELALAAATGVAEPQAVALRTAGLLERGDAAIERLRTSLDRHQDGDSPVEQARTLVALGAALRQAGRRQAAEQRLREGLGIAHSSGAERLAGHAEEELRALGFRPRRRAMFGVDALTPSELRVAREAARGVTNRDIAQSLFVTLKTVESQLRSAYQKLEIAGRSELAAALERRDTTD